ncbi:MAG TPA: alpha/beta hydrolase [Chryseolinea sp.]
MNFLSNTVLLFFFVSVNTYSQSAESNDIDKKTFTYKTIDKIQIKADLFRTADNTSLKPVIIWIHGGALIFGSRNDLPEEQKKFYLKAGYSLVSIDYRLAPSTKLPEIVDDVADAIQWVHKNGPDSLGIDPEKIFVVGHSGGAYLALTSGYSSKIRPRAIVSFYGYGDIRGKWYTSPSAFYLTQPAVSKSRAEKLMSDSVITSASFQDRFDLYLYSRQKGNWPDLVSGHDPKKEAQWFKTFCPIDNIDAGYPPVLLIHGDKDTDVPFSQSAELDRVLESKGIKHKFLQMKNYGHVFDAFGGGLANPDVANVFNEISAFLGK